MQVNVTGLWKWFPLPLSLLKYVGAALQKRLASIEADQQCNEMFAGVFSKVLFCGGLQNARMIYPRIQPGVLMNDHQRRVIFGEFGEFAQVDDWAPLQTAEAQTPQEPGEGAEEGGMGCGPFQNGIGPTARKTGGEQQIRFLLPLHPQPTDQFCRLFRSSNDTAGFDRGDI